MDLKTLNTPGRHAHKTQLEITDDAIFVFVVGETLQLVLGNFKQQAAAKGDKNIGRDCTIC